MKKGVILFGHGSRDPQWRAPMDAVAARIVERSPEMQVRCAFLELQQPDLVQAAHELAQAGVTHVSILPMFLGAGRHAREDLPKLVDAASSSCPGVRIELRPPVGEESSVLDLLSRIALE